MGRFNSPVDLSSPQLEAQSLFHTHHSSSLDNKFSRIKHLAIKFAQTFAIPLSAKLTIVALVDHLANISIDSH